MEKKIYKNYFYNLFYQVVSIIIPLIMIPYKTRVLSSTSIGIYSYVFSVLSYLLMLGNIGISLYGQREIAYLVDDKYKRSKLFFELLILRFIFLSLVIIIFYIVFGIRSVYRTFYIIGLVEGVASFFDVIWFFQGIQDFKTITIINTVSRIIEAICIFLFIKSDMDLTSYFIITVVFYCLPMICSFLLSLKKIDFTCIKKLNCFKHFMPCLILFIPQICIQIYTVCDKIMLGIFQESISEVGYYEYSNKIILIILQIVSSLTAVMIPVLSNQFKKMNHNKIIKYINGLVTFCIFFTIPITFGLIGVSSNLAFVFLGEKFIKSQSLLKILAFSIFPISLTGVVEHYLITTKQEKKFTFYILIGTFINVILNLLLISKYTSFGVSIATVITEFMVLFVEFPIIFRFMSVDIFLKYVFKYLFCSIVMFIFVYCIGYFGSNIYILGFQVAVGIFIYFFMLFILRDRLFRDFLRHFFHK